MKMLRELGNEEDIKIVSDSQAAISALTTLWCRSKLVNCRKEEIRSLGGAGTYLIWVLGHKNVDVDELADELARKGTELVSELPDLYLRQAQKI